MLSGHVATTVQMPSRNITTGDSCKKTYTVRYIDMTEEQESQWVLDFSLLCLELYEESRQIRSLDSVQYDTMNPL